METGAREGRIPMEPGASPMETGAREGGRPSKKLEEPRSMLLSVSPFGSIDEGTLPNSYLGGTPG
jgi:hypothetical protein